jgi:DNA primase
VSYVTFTLIMITKDTIAQIVSRIDIIDVIGNFIKLKKRGVNYLGNCPFHNEKSPSFTVSASKEIYKCFGCGKSGNTIGFVMEHEKYSYVEALKWLANRYNITVEETEYTPEQKALYQTSDSLFIINNFAQQHFTNNLWNVEEGKNIGLSYFKERGFNEDTIKKFMLGYALESRTDFANAALQKKYDKELLVKTGIVIDRDGTLVDNYRGRVLFPIHNQSGKIIGFGARILKKNDKAPKYINTPQNDLYDKSKILYGLYFARQTIDKQNECFLVEGYTDVVSLHQAGIENVVASGGTSLTIDQLRLVKKFTKNLTILYDGDNAGVKAALRGLDLALEQGLQVKVVLIPDGEDPDSYVNKVGKDAFVEFIKNNKQDVVLFQLKVALQQAGDDSAAKGNLVNQIAETISKINKTEDFTRQQDYIKQCSTILKIDEQGLHHLVNKFIKDKAVKLQEESNYKRQDNEMPPPMIETDNIPDDDTLNIIFKDELQERNIARVLIEYGNKIYKDDILVADYLFREGIDMELFDNKEIVQLLELYRTKFNNGEATLSNDFLYNSDLKIAAAVVSLIDFPHEVSANWLKKFEIKTISKDELYLEDVESSIFYLQLRKIKRMIASNQNDMEHCTEEELPIILETHRILKEQEMELTKRVGMVIL